MCTTLKEQVRSYTKATASNYGKRLQKFCQNDKFLSMFCQELQKLLKLIYDLTRKGRPLVCGKEQQDSSEEIMCRPIKPSVLHMPNKTGRFHLYSDMSKFATGSALYQIQNGKPQLIAYTSKRLPEAAKCYSITELKLCSLARNIASFSHLLKRVDFDATVDHLVLTHIIKSKTEQISSCSFNLYYMKGKDMILSNFLSQQKNDDSNPHEIMPISFNMYHVLENKFYDDKYLIQMRSQARSRCIKFPEVHVVGKNLDPNLKPERQHTLPKQGSMERPHVGQGRAGSKRKKLYPINHAIKQASNLSQKIPGRTEIETRKTNHVHTKDLTHSINNVNDKMANNNPLIPDVAKYPGPVYTPPPKPIK